MIWLLAPAVSGRAPACTAQQLRLLLSQPISEATGQHTTIFAVRNVSATDCYLNGYPSISLLDRNGRILSFTYHDGGDQMLTSNRPGRVGLVPGGYSYFAINKYRCDRGALSAGTTILAGIPGSAKLSLRSGISVDYCGPGDPGTLVSVSPFEINYMGLIHG